MLSAVDVVANIVIVRVIYSKCSLCEGALSGHFLVKTAIHIIIISSATMDKLFNPTLRIRNDKAHTVILDDLSSLSIGRTYMFTLVSMVEFKILQGIWLYSELLLGQICF